MDSLLIRKILEKQKFLDRSWDFEGSKQTTWRDPDPVHAPEQRLQHMDAVHDLSAVKKMHIVWRFSCAFKSKRK